MGLVRHKMNITVIFSKSVFGLIHNVLFLKGETFFSLLVTFFWLLVSFCSLFVSFCSLLVTFCSLFVTFCSLFVTFCSLLVFFCSLLFARYSLLFTRCSTRNSGFFLVKVNKRFSTLICTKSLICE